MSAPPTVTTKRVPPPCWTPAETLALIKAYADRWLSLNRRYLRTSDWDAVSSAVSASNPGPPKSALQCRHKIEKLRIRYRAEKQRCLALPGRFVSSWDLFPLLDSMNFGASSAAGLSNQVHDTYDQKITDFSEARVKTMNDKNLTSKYRKSDDDLHQDFGLSCGLRDGLPRNYDKIDFDDDFGGGFGIKMINDSNLLNLESRANDNMNIDVDDCDFGVGFGVKLPCDRKYVNQGVRLKSNRKIDDQKSSRILDFHCNIDGFPVKTLGDRILAPVPGFKPKNYSKIDGNFYPNNYHDHDADYGVSNGSGSGFCAKTSDRGFLPSRIRLKNYDRVDGNYNGNVDFRVMNVYDSSSRLRFGKKNDGGGVKRPPDPFEELVSSITLLTERFVKMEEMKMEMAMETQKMRMEMEMKHSQMILESQQHILDAFLTGLLEKKKKKKKVKVELVSPNRTRNGDEV
ncbi:hypothetical protein ACOSP7_025409 [Xanthoceras sorbifolium]|uniref:Myb/SANT-like DNA-binding domain-containing protein n=1 Tax=Xanthoceras sorbifolium TaxID=99658 RepID=A0ABQ8H707_9ROSI|nr:hypothetical protein JRO89_XS13G0067200 [Xanthoceras sorbifolium]